MVEYNCDWSQKNQHDFIFPLQGFYHKKQDKGHKRNREYLPYIRANSRCKKICCEKRQNAEKREIFPYSCCPEAQVSAQNQEYCEHYLQVCYVFVIIAVENVQ